MGNDESNSGRTSCNVRVEQRVHGIAAAGQGRSRVETKPAHLNHGLVTIEIVKNARGVDDKRGSGRYPKDTGANGGCDEVAVGKSP